MFYQISTWALMLTAVSHVLASPISPSNDTRSLEADVIGSCSIKCPRGQGCIQVVCGGGYCPLPDCANCPDCISKRSAESTLAERQLECNKDTCNFPECADAEVCQNKYPKRELEDRQFECPPGVDCSPPIQCNPQTCDFPGCADAEACQNNKDQKRNAETDLANRNCDICQEDPNGVLVCGCECNVDHCDNPKCASSDVCQEKERRSRIATCDCSDHPNMCACAINTREEPKRRETERFCPQYCITISEDKTLCGCDAQDYERLLQGK